MATAKHTTPHTMKFNATTRPLYVLAPGVTANQIGEEVYVRLAQLDAMLTVTFGDTGEVFRSSLSEDAQENYMWACNTMLSEVRELFGLMHCAGGVA